MPLPGPRRLPFLLVLAALLLRPGAPAPSRADTPDAAGASRIALIDGSKLWGPTGIAAYTTGRMKLAADRSSFTVAERPPGVPPPAGVNAPNLSSKAQAKLKERLAERDRERVRHAAWRAHERAILDPIRAEVLRALDRYARARGIGLVLDRSKLDSAVLIAAPGVDLTDAFITAYNASTASTPAPRPDR